MPYEPTFPQPYLKAIDVSLAGGNNFQCVINPRDVITAYTLTISKASDGSAVYSVIGEKTSSGTFKKYYKIGSATKVAISTIPPQDTPLPLQGKANSDDSTLVINVPKNNTLTNGNEYVWNITLTDKSGKTSTSRDYYFSTATTPSVSFTVPQIIYGSHLNVVAEYSQAENLTPAYYRFDLYRGADLVYTTDDIFSTDIEFTFDRLINDRSYTLELIVTLDNGMEVEQSASFDVSYSEVNTLVAPTAVANNHDGYVTIDFSNSANIKGVIEGNQTGVSYTKAYNAGDDIPDVENIAQLDENTSVYWNKSNTDSLELENAEHLVHIHLHKLFSGKVFEKIDETNPLRNISVYFKDGQFYYNVGTKEPVYYNTYTDVVTAIAGENSFSAILEDHVSYAQATPSITLKNHPLIRKGCRIQMQSPGYGCEYRTIVSVDVGESETVAILDEPFNLFIVQTYEYLMVYDPSYLYTIPETATIGADDILIDHEPTPEDWYYLHVKNSGIEFIKDENNITIEEVS